MATLSLTKWACNLTPSDVPPSIQRAALRSLYNYLGCAIGGSNHPTVSKARFALAPFFGSPTSHLLGCPERLKVDAQHAALLNGISSHVHDYDDTHLSTIIHPTGPIASAVLAVLPLLTRPVSGAELLCALVAGIETSCKLGLAVWPSHYDIGWHITSTTGSIGAAVAVSKLLGLDAVRTAHAVGIAATQVTGLREMFGSDAKSFHPGKAAQAGLQAAVLAEKDFTSSESALEAKRGWANVVVDGVTPQLEKYLSNGEDGLGQTWEVERNAFKPFPCGIVCHPAIDGCVQLHHDMQQRGLNVEDIENVEEIVHPLVIELTNKQTPKDGLEAKFSVFHGSAVGLLYGKAGPAEYADEIVTRTEVVKVRDKIGATAKNDTRPDEVHLVAKFRDGTRLERHIEHAIGSLDMPMTDEQLTKKFIDQCALVVGSDDARKASDAIWAIAKAEDVVQVLAKL